MRKGTPSTTTSRPTGSTPPKSLAPSVAPTTATELRRRSSSSVRTAAAADRPVHEQRVLRREAGDEDALGASGDPHASRLRRPRQEGESALVWRGDAREVLVAKARGSWRSASAPRSSRRPWAARTTVPSQAMPSNPVPTLSRTPSSTDVSTTSAKTPSMSSVRVSIERSLCAHSSTSPPVTTSNTRFSAGAQGEPATHNAGPPSGRAGSPSTRGRARRRTRRPKRGRRPTRSSSAA